MTESLDAGIANVSSEELADLAGVNAAKVRKDLSYLGTYGVRGVGYDVEYLVYQVRRELGLDHDWPVVIVGAGNLGQALAGYGGFRDRGFPVAGVVDVDDSKIGTTVGGIEVRPAPPTCMTSCAVATRRSAGSPRRPAPPSRRPPTARSPLPRSILNFAPVLLAVPGDRGGAQGRPGRSSCRSSATTSSVGLPSPSPNARA